jgi:oligopeptide transport system substrate-binding protein
MKASTKRRKAFVIQLQSIQSSQLRLVLTLILLAAIAAACTASAGNRMFFGKTDPPRDNTLRYVSGSEPESIDPQIPTGQNEARICLALYDGLTDYDPKTSEPVPALAQSWEVNQDSSQFVFHLRRSGRFSNGDPITAHDFVYTIRRGLNPEVGARYASMGYPIKYAEAFNSKQAFVLDPASNSYLLEKDFAETPPPPTASAEPARLLIPADPKPQKKVLDANPKLKAAIAGKQLVKVKAEDVGIEAVDDYTLRITLTKPAPYFLSMIAHPFFRVLHQKTVEGFQSGWTDADKIVTSGPFKLETWKHYDRISVVRDPMYWDAANVRLDRIIFYLITENTTIMNLYKAGELDAMYNHTVPAAWLDVIGPTKDFMDEPEAAIDFYLFNCTNGPTKDVRVRKALNMAVNKDALAAWRHVKPLTAMTPGGIFPGYPQPKGDPFDPEKAKHLLAEAGYRDSAGNFDPEKFTASEIEMITNPDANNLSYAEFIQAQWKQNLGVTIQIRVMEGKTFNAAQAKLEYKGVSRTGWGADYMDPFTFLGLFYTAGGTNATGWWDPKYAALLDEANRTVDHQKRYDLLAQAEKLLLDAQPVMPLTAGSTRWMKKPYVKGLYPNPVALHPWKAVYIERDSAKWDYKTPSMSD